MASDQVRGPAAYYPSIEAKYGRSIAEWKAEKELMAWLKENHSFGHGHANALVIDFLNERKGRT